MAPGKAPGDVGEFTGEGAVEEDGDEVRDEVTLHRAVDAADQAKTPDGGRPEGAELGAPAVERLPPRATI
jgi:hypothetical protein